MPGTLVFASPYYKYQDLLRFKEYNMAQRAAGSKKKILVLFGDNDKDKFRSSDTARAGNALQAGALSRMGNGVGGLDRGEDFSVLGIVTVAHGGPMTVGGRLDEALYSAQLAKDVSVIKEVLANDGVVVVPYDLTMLMTTLGAGSANMASKDLGAYVEMCGAIADLEREFGPAKRIGSKDEADMKNPQPPLTDRILSELGIVVPNVGTVAASPVASGVVAAPVSVASEPSAQSRVADIKKELRKTVEDFEAKQAAKKSIHGITNSSEHFDWWAFPVNSASEHGGGVGDPGKDKYRVGDVEIRALKADREFMSDRKYMVKNYFAEMGWDIESGMENDKGFPAGIYPHSNTGLYTVRLAKCLLSMKLFGESELYNSALKFLKESGLMMQFLLSDDAWGLHDYEKFSDVSKANRRRYLVTGSVVDGLEIFKSKKDEFDRVDDSGNISAAVSRQVAASRPVELQAPAPEYVYQEGVRESGSYRHFLRPKIGDKDDYNSSFAVIRPEARLDDKIISEKGEKIFTTLQKLQNDFDFSPKEVAAIILIAIERQGVSRVGDVFLQTDLHNIYSKQEDLDKIEIDASYLIKVKNYSINFQKAMKADGILTGNIVATNPDVGMRLKRLTFDHAVAICGKRGDVEKMQSDLKSEMIPIPRPESPYSVGSDRSI